MKLDETNKAIIRQLSEGRKAFSTIAEAVGVTENTVRSRVNSLEKEGILKITGLVNPQTIPEIQVVIMGIKLNCLDLEEKAKELIKLKGVVSAVVVTGRYDIIIQIVTQADDNQNLLNFFKNELSKVSNISDVETFVVYQSHNFGVPVNF